MNDIIIWSRSIIISVIITIVIEMILPENNSKKYIKIVLGIFVVYSIVSPIFEFFSGRDVDGIIDKGEAAIEASSRNIQDYESRINSADEEVRKIYSNSLVKELETLLQNNGYIPEKVDIAITNDDSYNIEKIDIKIKEKKKVDEKQAQSIVETVKQIVIKCDNKNRNEEKSLVNDNEKNEIRAIIKDNFGVDNDKVNIF